MEGEKYLCPSCGMPIEAHALNLKTRRGYCAWCDKNVIFPKKNSTASPSAVHALNEAYRFFLEKNFESAQNCAETVVSMTPNNVAALYIIAYYKAFSAPVKNRTSLDRLMNETLQEAEFEIEEEEMFKDLILKTILHSGEYIEQLITRFAEFDDPKELAEFVEAYAPFAIGNKGSINFFTPALADALASITEMVDIPKTWFALYSAISKNPDSPIPKDTFYLKTKTQRFYNDFVLRVGEIFSKIKTPALRAKFKGAYDKVKATFDQKMN
ncbi:MAG: hypothetical protein IJB13_07265 [Clostridia bacterium]|nr:hypothetical protein [Clostridia bacterium]